MGGASGLPAISSRATKYAEFNLYVDPEAADQVFRANWPDISAVGLDVTHAAPVSAEVWSLIRNSNSAPAQLIQALYRSRVENPDTGQSYIHDAMAVAAALDPDLIDWEPHDIEMQTDDVHRGQSRLVPGKTSASSARGRCADVHAALLRTTGYHQHAEPNQGINNRRTKQKEAHHVRCN